MDVQQRHVRERRHDDRAGPDADRADPEPDEKRCDEERERAERPGGRDAAGTNTRSVPHPKRLRDHDRLATAATTRAKSTMRGPQREATLSSTVTTRLWR